LKKFTLFLIFLFLFSSCATLKPHPRPWTKSEKIAAGYFILGHLADALTTERALDNPNIDEINPILGNHPSDSKVAIYFSFTGIAIFTISHFYPELRLPLLSVFGTVGFGYAIHNKRLMDN